MEENLKNEQSVSGDVVDNTDYIEALKELKQNSVSKDKYDALNEEKKRLLEAIVNGEEASAQEKEPTLESRDVYYKKYKENNFSNDLEYWDNFLKLRKATIKEYGSDPCVTGSYGLTPDGGKIDPTYGEADIIAEQMDMIEDFVKKSEGNPIAFESLLQSALPRK